MKTPTKYLAAQNFICSTIVKIKANLSQEEEEDDRGSLVYRLYLWKPVEISTVWKANF